MNALLRWDPFKEMDDVQSRFVKLFGANGREAARKLLKHDPNFAQSRDAREGRGERQIKMAVVPQTVRSKRWP